MKNIKQLFWLSSLVMLAAGCALPVHEDHTLAEWQREGLLPPTGAETSRVYQEPANYPPQTPGIVVQSDRNNRGDAILADSIRQEVQYDLGLAPSLQHVVIVVENGHLTLQGAVRSDLDARVIVDNLRDITGVTDITDELEINPYID